VPDSLVVTGSLVAVVVPDSPVVGPEVGPLVWLLVLPVVVPSVVVPFGSVADAEVGLVDAVVSAPPVEPVEPVESVVPSSEPPQADSARMEVVKRDKVKLRMPPRYRPRTHRDSPRRMAGPGADV
jgi:hypothetical protein